jgi:hypothetical protein
MNSTQFRVENTGTAIFTFAESVIFVRWFYGDHNPFNDDYAKSMMIDGMTKSFIKQDNYTKQQAEHKMKRVIDLANSIANADGLIDIPLNEEYELVINSCILLLQYWVFYGLMDHRFKIMRKISIDNLEAQISQTKWNIGLVNQETEPYGSVMGKLHSIGNKMKDNLKTIGFEPHQMIQDFTGGLSQMETPWFKERNDQKRFCGFEVFSDITNDDLKKNTYKFQISFAFTRHIECGICNTFVQGYGNNAAPICEFCCDKCNEVVIARRMILLEEQKKQELKNKEMEMEAELKREAIEKELLSQGNVKVICEKPKTKKQLQAEATREANNVKKAADKAKMEYEKACEIARLARAKSAQDKQKKILKAKRDNQIKCALAYATVPRNF